MSNMSGNLDVEELSDEVDLLKRQIYELRIEKDILEKSTELIKKDPGINPTSLSNKEKSIVIDALRKHYSLGLLLEKMSIAKSSYFYHR